MLDPAGPRSSRGDEPFPRAWGEQSAIGGSLQGAGCRLLPTLAALVEAAGFDLEVSVRRQPGRLARLTGPVGRRVRQRRRELVAAAAAHGVASLRVFGSVARQDCQDSDVDLLADLPPGMGLLGRLGRVAGELHAIVGVPVDLAPAADLKPDVRQRAERDLVAL